LNVAFRVFALYEATRDPILPPFDFVEFAFEFSGGPHLKHPYYVVCVEVGAHGGVLKVEIAGSSRILPEDVFSNPAILRFDSREAFP
jgi:hypothetical protein